MAARRRDDRELRRLAGASVLLIVLMTTVTLGLSALLGYRMATASCEQLRSALRSGDQPEIDVAMKLIKSDSARGTSARQAAADYLTWPAGRDKDVAMEGVLAECGA